MLDPDSKQDSMKNAACSAKCSSPDVFETRLLRRFLYCNSLKFVLADNSARHLSLREVNVLLSTPNILRLAVVDERDGLPIVHPVWYVYKDDMFLIATDRDGVKARSLRKNSNAYFLVDIEGRPPCGVRGKCTAKVIDDCAYATQITRENVLKYLGTVRTKTAKRILAMGPYSSVIEITPDYMATWKF